MEESSKYPHTAEEALKTKQNNRGGDGNREYQPLKSGQTYSRDQLGDDLTAYIKNHRGGSRGATNLPATVGFSLDWAVENAKVLSELSEDERQEARISHETEGHRNGRQDGQRDDRDDRDDRGNRGDRDDRDQRGEQHQRDEDRDKGRQEERSNR